MYIAYQTWQNPSWQSGPRYSKRVSGRGKTAKEAIFDATHYIRDCQVWAYGSGSWHPNASDLSIDEIEDEIETEVPAGYAVSYRTLRSGHGKAWHAEKNGEVLHPPLLTREDAVQICWSDRARN